MKAKTAQPQFITDQQGKKVSVILPMKEYMAILENLEELEDIKLYDKVKARNEKSVPLEEYLKTRKKKG